MYVPDVRCDDCARENRSPCKCEHYAVQCNGCGTEYRPGPPLLDGKYVYCAVCMRLWIESFTGGLS